MKNGSTIIFQFNNWKISVFSRYIDTILAKFLQNYNKYSVLFSRNEKCRIDLPTDDVKLDLMLKQDNILLDRTKETSIDYYLPTYFLFIYIV